jgi:hypothetical protein
MRGRRRSSTASAADGALAASPRAAPGTAADQDRRQPVSRREPCWASARRLCRKSPSTSGAPAGGEGIAAYTGSVHGTSSAAPIATHKPPRAVAGRRRPGARVAAIQLAVLASFRRGHTRHDELLMSGVDRAIPDSRFPIPRFPDSQTLQGFACRRRFSQRADDGSRTRDLRLGKPRRRTRQTTTIRTNHLETAHV